MILLIAAVAGLLVGCGWWLFDPGADPRLKSLLGAPRGGRGKSVGDSDRGRGARSGAMGSRVAEGSGERAAGAGEPGPSTTSAMSAVDALAFDLDLVSICLQTGLPTERALSLAAAAGGDRTGLDRLGRSLALGEIDDSNEELAAVSRLVLFSRSTGVALAPLLRGLAGDLRRAEHRRRQIAAARLGVELVVPLGVCVLPAFLLLGVVPVVLSLVDDLGVLFG